MPDWVMETGISIGFNLRANHSSVKGFGLVLSTYTNQQTKVGDASITAGSKNPSSRYACECIDKGNGKS